MKKFKVFIGMVFLSAFALGCSSTYHASAGYAYDDLYAVHDRTAIARKQQAEAEAQRAEAEARKAQWEARIAEAEAAAAENRYYEYKSPDTNPYQSILADDYESAYARRLKGFESPTYKMPSSYLDARYSSAFTYASAYDPAFYNIVISGDQVWVEPKYITSMFGVWGGTVLVDPWYYGWNWPWGPSFSIGSWGWNLTWNTWYNPWYYSWYGPWRPWYSAWYDPWWNWGWRPGWGPGWPGRPPHFWAGGPRPVRPSYGSMVRRPDPYTSPSARYGTRTRYGSAPSSAAPSSGNSGRRTYFGIRDNNSGSYDSSSRSYRNNNSGSWNNRSNSGSNSYNRGNSSSFSRGSSSSSPSFGGGSGTRPSGGSSRNAGGR